MKHFQIAFIEFPITRNGNQKQMHDVIIFCAPVFNFDFGCPRSANAPQLIWSCC